MSYLLDADASIDYLSGHPGSGAFLQALGPAQLFVAATTLVERYTGVYRDADSGAAQRRLEIFLRTLTILPLSDQVILRAARLRANLLNRGLSIRSRAYDILAAAFALEHELTLVTSNTSDYRGIVGLMTFDARTGRSTTH